jgi:hypothetical protein
MMKPRPVVSSSNNKKSIVQFQGVSIGRLFGPNPSVPCPEREGWGGLGPLAGSSLKLIKSVKEYLVRENPPHYT